MRNIKVNRMKFKYKPEPKLSDERIVTKFLLFPKRIGDERRWLETATFKQEYREVYEQGYGQKWIDVSWWWVE